MINPCLGCFMVPCRTSKQKKIMILTFDTNLRTHRNLILLACPVLWNWSKFNQAYYPRQNLSLDEMVVGWTGRWKYKMYNASKPKRYHVKVFGLVDSTTGYTINLLIYFGKETSYSADLNNCNSQAVKVFEYLLRPLSTKGHHIFADRYYTSEALVQYLSENGHYFTGTLNINRKGFPSVLKTLRLDHQQRKWYFNRQRHIMCAAWKDKKAKKPVVIISTNSTTHMAEKETSRKRLAEKPVVIQNYNAFMNGCDRVDQNAAYYPIFNRKTLKWWKKLYHWTIELIQLNALVLFNESHQNKMDLATFKRSLLRQLVESAAVLMPAGERTKTPGCRNTQIERFQGAKHIISYSKDDRNCVVCSRPGARKRTNFFVRAVQTNPTSTQRSALKSTTLLHSKTRNQQKDKMNCK